MSDALSRRDFCSVTAAAATAITAPALFAADGSPNERVRLGVMGCRSRSRGTALAKAFAQHSNVEIAWICDVDERELPDVSTQVKKHQKAAPQQTDDFRRILDDKNVDALVIAAPDHWHAPAAIAAIQAGKHAYVEKPCTHNPQEGVWLAEQAEQHSAIVQHGTQRRSWPAIVDGIAKLKEGLIGDVLGARCWYFNDRPSIGTGKKTAPPSWLNWKLWQGPAPDGDYQDNLVHYNWHWFWKYGTAEVGNNGVHFIDVCRWGLGVDHATEVTMSGGRYRYDDDQETPETAVAHFTFPEGKYITWEGRSWGKRHSLDPIYDWGFFGTKGSLFGRQGYWKAYALDGKEIIADQNGDAGDADHTQNFIDAIRGDAKLTAPIDEGVKSALLCHLANISYRTGQRVDFNAESMTIASGEAQALWGRDYSDEFRPQV